MAIIRSNQMDDLTLSPVERDETFAKRGIAVLLTTPELGSARLRRVGDGQIELIVPGLGGRGVYVLEWGTALHRVQPTLYDHELWPHLAAMRRLTPATVRHTCRSVAALGSAGRDAASSAVAAINALERAREEAERHLSVLLAPILKEPTAQARVKWLAGVLADVGAGNTDGELLQAHLANMQRLAAEAIALSERLPPGHERAAATVVAAGARLTLSAIPSCSRPLRTALAELPTSFAAGEPTLELIAMLVERVNLLLDGWAGLVAFWDAVPFAERGYILGDLLSTLPVPAREANAWSGRLVAWDDLEAARRRIPLKTSRHFSGRVASVTLNEVVLARAA